MGYFLSEWKLRTKAQDISLVIYHLPQSHMESSEIEKETKRIFYQLRRLNSYPVMGHSKTRIASIEPLENWGELTYRGEPEIRPIRLDSREERRLLESVLITDCIDSMPRDKLFIRGRRIISREPVKFRSVEVRRYLHFDIQVRASGDILFGFDLAHDFNLRTTLWEMLNNNHSRVREGMEVYDHTSGRVYLYSKKLDKTISDPILDSGESLIEYQKNKYGSRFLQRGISPQTYAVECLSRDGQALAFIPQFLHPVSRLENIKEKDAIRYVKIEPNKRTNKLIQWGKSILGLWKMVSSLNIDATDKGWFITSTGYQPLELKRPILQFGNQKQTISKVDQIRHGLSNGKVFAPPSDPIYCHYLLDHDTLKELQEIKDRDVSLSKYLSEESQKLGVPLKSSSYNVIQLTNTTDLRIKLKQIAPNIQPDHLVIFVAGKRLNDDFYEIIKQELGREYQLNSQVIRLDTVKNTQSRSFAITNILLGIYCKSGVQPWVLSRPLHADCFIGLDVSHKDKKHISGVVQVIGKVGEVLWSKPMSSLESGEKIDPKSLEQIITEALHRYITKYDKNFNHLIIHRDGKGHESEIQAIEQIMKGLGIPFDYVSIAKTFNRRMAINEMNHWENPEGIAFLRQEENLAYLCSTNPHPIMGMAQPIRIWNRTGNMDLKSIVEDIYHLSYMNIHATNKSRLPVTTNYADKSSVFYRREMLPLETELRFGFV